MTGHARERAISAVRRVMVVGAIAALCSALPVPGAKATSASTLSPGKLAGQQAGASSIPLFAYYYLWFNHTSWNRAKKDYPLVGTYSSSDPRIVRIQMREAKSAGINGFIVSWKNTTIDDQRMRLLFCLRGAGALTGGAWISRSRGHDDSLPSLPKGSLASRRGCPER